MQTERIPCVAAILSNAARHILLIQRDEKPDLAFGGYWTLPGGRVEDNESPTAAIRRELQEEIGIVPVLTFWKVYDRPHHQLLNDNAIVIEQHVYVGQMSVRAYEIVLRSRKRINPYFWHQMGTDMVE